MKRATLALALGAVLSVSAQAGTLLSEGFDDISTLSPSWKFQSGLVINPNTWFQGNSGVFASQAGALENSYIASNWLAQPVIGFIDNYLVTPTFSLASDVVLTFWARAELIDGFTDEFGVFLGTTVPDASEVATQVLADSVALGEWTKYTVNVSGQGAGSVGRFAFNYFGSDQTLNYFGIDTIDVSSVEATVPEPSTTALFGIAMLGALLNRRRKTGAQS
jgi:hypothetical protein